MEIDFFFLPSDPLRRRDPSLLAEQQPQSVGSHPHSTEQEEAPVAPPTVSAAPLFSDYDIFRSASQQCTFQALLPHHGGGTAADGTPAAPERGHWIGGLVVQSVDTTDLGFDGIHQSGDIFAGRRGHDQYFAGCRGACSTATRCLEK